MWLGECHTAPDGACPALKITCGYCQKVGHYESACITKYTQKNKEAKESKDRYERCSLKRRSATPMPNK